MHVKFITHEIWYTMSKTGDVWLLFQLFFTSDSVTDVIFTVTAQFGRQLYLRHLKWWQVDAAGVTKVGSYWNQFIDKLVLGIQFLQLC